MTYRVLASHWIALGGWAPSERGYVEIYRATLRHPGAAIWRAPGEVPETVTAPATRRRRSGSRGRRHARATMIGRALYR